MQQLLQGVARHILFLAMVVQAREVRLIRCLGIALRRVCRDTPLEIKAHTVTGRRRCRDGPCERRRHGVGLVGEVLPTERFPCITLVVLFFLHSRWRRIQVDSAALQRRPSAIRRHGLLHALGEFREGILTEERFGIAQLFSSRLVAHGCDALLVFVADILQQRGHGLWRSATARIARRVAGAWRHGVRYLRRVRRCCTLHARSAKRRDTFTWRRGMRMATGRVALADLPHDGAGRSCLFTRGLARTTHRAWLRAHSSRRRRPVDPGLVAVHIAHVGHTRPDLLVMRHEEERRGHGTSTQLWKGLAGTQVDPVGLWLRRCHDMDALAGMAHVRLAAEWAHSWADRRDAQARE